MVVAVVVVVIIVVQITAPAVTHIDGVVVATSVPAFHDKKRIASNINNLFSGFCLLESTQKGVNEHSKDVTQTQQKPESPKLTPTWYASKYKVQGT